MVTREKVLEAVKNMPQEFSIDDLMDKLLLLNKIEIGLDQSKNGETFTAEEAKKMIKEWSK
ncbi:hypothetical protein [Algoriphagus aquimarinus]|uniref:Uncharacterized protein n=1 Tax=Algoriphagus aquimarinus TaxID=237018 RepID=A0A1I0ZI79_9BACT|nr:hypothetical protein [Algoriphagus aquimarinus]SFB24240.1 hypothetical protein SAMN04489723_10633 [Algoriphagus aquimarinus]|tara:strand:- start:2625 stop:2807 length:183 start_codon:yes stop_codon:yes gene_type:complete